jgi:hypothetical protein
MGPFYKRGSFFAVDGKCQSHLTSHDPLHIAKQHRHIEDPATSRRALNATYITHFLYARFSRLDLSGRRMYSLNQFKNLLGQPSKKIEILYDNLPFRNS